MNEVRVDKWLWAMRVFKTRTVATEACKKGRVYVGDTVIKPSRTIKVGDVVKVRKPPVTYSFRVRALPQAGANLPNSPTPYPTDGISTSLMTTMTNHKDL